MEKRQHKKRVGIEKREYKKRNLWGEESERVLIDVWRTKIDELRGVRKNSHIVEKMAAELQQLGVMCTPSEVITKMHNMSARYRKEKKVIGPSDGATSEWPLYMEMNQLLGPYKSFNSENLVEEIKSENSESLEISLESPSGVPNESWVSPNSPSDCVSPAPSTSAAARASGKKNFQKRILEKLDKIEKEMEKCNKDLRESDIEFRETSKAFLENEMVKTCILEEYVNDNKQVNKAIIEFLQKK